MYIKDGIELTPEDVAYNASIAGVSPEQWVEENEFNTVEECQLYVTFNADSIKMNMAGMYGPKPIEMVYCVREDHLTEFGVPEKI